jgi:hypothetical protein
MAVVRHLSIFPLQSSAGSSDQISDAARCFVQANSCSGELLLLLLLDSTAVDGLLMLRRSHLDTEGGHAHAVFAVALAHPPSTKFIFQLVVLYGNTVRPRLREGSVVLLLLFAPMLVEAIFGGYHS